MTEPVLIDRTEHFAGTADELVSWCIQRDLRPEDVRLTGCHLKFQTPQTPEEAQRLADWQARNAQRTEAYERETYARLQVKFTPPAEPTPVLEWVAGRGGVRSRDLPPPPAPQKVGPEFALCDCSHTRRRHGLDGPCEAAACGCGGFHTRTRSTR